MDKPRLFGHEENDFIWFPFLWTVIHRHWRDLSCHEVDSTCLWMLQNERSPNALKNYGNVCPLKKMVRCGALVHCSCNWDIRCSLQHFWCIPIQAHVTCHREPNETQTNPG
jgi:hypothetical protein